MHLQVTVPDAIAKKLDTYCQANSDTRSGVVANCLNSFLKQVELIELLNRVVALMEEIADNGDITPEQEKQLKTLKSVLYRATTQNLDNN